MVNSYYANSSGTYLINLVRPAERLRCRPATKAVITSGTASNGAIDPGDLDVDVHGQCRDTILLRMGTVGFKPHPAL